MTPRCPPEASTNSITCEIQNTPQTRKYVKKLSEKKLQESTILHPGLARKCENKKKTDNTETDRKRLLCIFMFLSCFQAQLGVGFFLCISALQGCLHSIRASPDRNSRISHISTISRRWSNSPCSSTLWVCSRLSRISGVSRFSRASRKWTF